MKATRTQNLFAAVLVIGILCAVSALFWTWQRSERLTGPGHLAVHGDDVYVHMNGTLYELSASGVLGRSVPLPELGIEGIVADLQALPDHRLLIGDLETQRVHLCDMEALSCQVVGPTDPEAIVRQFNFFAHESSGQLYITDNHRHRLLIQPLNGGRIQELADRTTLRCPNFVWVSDEGRIHVADTNHHRVVTLEYENGSVREIAPTLPGQTGLTRPGRTWPVAFEQSSDGTWWVLNADGVMEDPDLVIYDKDGVPLRRVPLPEEAEFFDIARLGKQFLLTDLKGMKIYIIEEDGDNHSLFGDETFHSIAAGVREQREEYRSMASTAGNALIALLVCVFVLVRRVAQTPEERAQRMYRPTVRTEQPLSRFPKVQWLEWDNKARKLLQIATWVVPLIFLLLPLSFFLIVSSVRQELEAAAMEELIVLGVFLAFCICVAFFVVAYMRRLLKMRLGADSSHLYFCDPQGRTFQASPEDVIYTERQVAYERVTVIVRDGIGRSLLSPVQFEQLVKPLLARAQKVGAVQMMMHQLTHDTAYRIWSLLILSLVILLFLAPRLWVPFL